MVTKSYKNLFIFCTQNKTVFKVSQFGESKYCTPNQYRHRQQLSGSQTHEKKIFSHSNLIPVVVVVEHVSQKINFLIQKKSFFLNTTLATLLRYFASSTHSHFGMKEKKKPRTWKQQMAESIKNP